MPGHACYSFIHLSNECMSDHQLSPDHYYSTHVAQLFVHCTTMVVVQHLGYRHKIRHKEAQYTSLLEFSFTDSQVFFSFLTGW